MFKNKLTKTKKFFSKNCGLIFNNISKQNMNVFSKMKLYSNRNKFLISTALIFTGFCISPFKDDFKCNFWSDDKENVSKKFQKIKRRIIEGIELFYGEKTSFAKSKITV